MNTSTPGARIVIEHEVTIEPLTCEIHERAIASMLLSQREHCELAERAIDAIDEIITSMALMYRGVGYHDALRLCLADHERHTEAAASAARAIERHRWALAQLRDWQ